MRIRDALGLVRGRIDAACQRGGRPAGSVTLLAVAKAQPVEKIAEALDAGIADIGENYAQEMREHAALLSRNPPVSPLTLRGDEKVRWHFVGRLQRNKVRQIIDSVHLIHSVDSLDLAQEIDRRAAKIGKIQPVLLEVNLGSEPTKGGIPPDEVGHFIASLKSLEHLALKGLMTIPPFFPNPEESRPFFRRLREIRDAISLPHLSMGMTHDFEVAIEEGATIVRIGTGIFGTRS